MPVLIDRSPTGSIAGRAAEQFLELGLVNNMPDTALESTERQFVELLRAAALDVPIRLRLFFIPAVPRGEAGRRHLRGGYLDLAELWDSRLDGLIVTGNEPRAPALSDEPYWRPLTQLLAWAEENTASTVWSCLAAHAAVLHLDGIERRPLAQKRFGVFECRGSSDHPLLDALPARLRIAHSRCNDLPEASLAASGYSILTRSAAAGVDTFAKQRRSLFVFFQGHPEYDERALLREFRRDLGRYLRRERETRPALPEGYFDAVGANAAAMFCERARRARDEALLEDFPAALLESHLRPAARDPIVRLYRNWLAYLVAQKASRHLRAPLRAHRINAPQPA